MLATRDDPLTALTASDSILGGRAQGLRWNGRYCYRALMTTRDHGGGELRGGRVATVGEVGERRVGQPVGNECRVHCVRSG